MLRRTAVVLLAFALSACSIKKYAINQVGDALAGTGATFASDDDPELIRSAVPFSLKLVESLLAESPKHQGLLLAAARGFTQYAYAFVQEEGDELDDTDRAAATALHARASRLYLRGRDYGLRGLDVKHPGFSARLKAKPKDAVTELKKADVPLIYWTAVSWAAALSVSRNFAMLAEIPRFEALADRALALDESYDEGTIHSFLITYEMSRLTKKPDAVEIAKGHYERAMALSKGHLAGPMVSYAENVLVFQKNKAEFQAMLTQALKVDLNAAPESRQLNLVSLRRARWLMARTEKLFPAARP